MPRGGTRQRGNLKKKLKPSLPSALSVALDKEPICRVPCPGTRQSFFIFFIFGLQIFCAALLKHQELLVRIWWFLWLFDIFSYFISFTWFFSKKYNFELHVVRIMEFNDSKNDSHVTESSVRPYPGTGPKFRTSCSRNMTANLRTKCF